MIDNKLSYDEKILLARSLLELEHKYPAAHSPNSSGFATMHIVKRQTREQPSNLPKE